MSEQVKLLRTYNQWRRSEIEGGMDELGLHPTDIGKAIDSVLDDYAALQAECARLKNSLLERTTRHFAERWKQASKDSELEQYLSYGIAQLEEERDAALAECERLLAQVSALKSDANSWQSWYDKGREDGAKSVDAWKAQHARDSAELRRLCAERDAMRSELAAIKAQQRLRST